MAHDLVAFGSAADRSAALTNAPILLAETTYPGNGVPGTGTQIYPKQDSYAFAYFSGDETVAAADNRWHTTNDPDWIRWDNSRLQTTPWWASVNRCMYKLGKGEAIEWQNQTGAAAATFSGLAILIAKKPGDEVYDITTPRPGWLRPGDMFVEATATFTHVADSWAQGTITWTNFTLDRTKKYQIVGMMAHSATGWATRLRYTAGPNVDDHPGVPTGDSGGTVPQHVMIYGDFGTFDGMNPPLCETSTVSGADAVTELHFVIRELQ